jgi:hypothetical protein
MKDLEDKPQEATKGELSRILNKDLFLFLLDLEVKRARRYQNFLCLLLMRLRSSQPPNQGDGFKTCYQTLSHLLIEEMRDSDILGSLEENKLAALLPYADALAGGHVKSRFENTLKFIDFKSKGWEVVIDQISFPINGAGTIDLMKNALEA